MLLVAVHRVMSRCVVVGSSGLTFDIFNLSSLVGNASQKYPCSALQVRLRITHMSSLLRLGVRLK